MVNLMGTNKLDGQVSDPSAASTTNFSTQISRSSMNFFRLITASVIVLVVTGCAHPISVTPKLASLDRTTATPARINAKVGFYIPPIASTTEVTTPGGGGDNVRYFPYRDIEAGFQKILSNVFSSSLKVRSIEDPTDGKRDDIDYVLIPQLVTTSGGSGFFTWPPTSFTVDLTSNVRDKNGKLLTSIRVVGAGSAETSERISETGIAGSRAMEDALIKMQASLFESEVFGGKAVVSSPQTKKEATGSTSARLAELKALRDAGQISEQEYGAKRKAILDSL